MASVAERKRRKKLAGAIARASAPLRAEPAPRLVKTQKYVRRQTGLESLSSRGKINGNQRANLDRYGRLFRVAAIEDGAAIKSSLADLEGLGGGKGGGLPTVDDYAVVIAQARAELEGARAVMSFNDALIVACDLVCGKSLTPQDVTDVRSEQVELETSLRLAGDLLAKHFAAVGWAHS